MCNYLEEIKCPFYIFSPPYKRRKVGMTNARFIIECEGIVDGMCVDVRFSNYDDYLKYKNHFCNSFEHFELCPYYQLANLKYEV